MVNKMLFVRGFFEREKELIFNTQETDECVKKYCAKGILEFELAL